MLHQSIDQELRTLSVILHYYPRIERIFKTRGLRQNLFDLKSLTMPKTVKGRHFEIFLTSILLQKFKKLKRDLKNFAKKKQNENFQQSHSAEILKERTLRDFLTFVLLQNTKKMKGGIFGDMKKNCEKKSQSRNNMHKKFWSRARLEPTSFCLADLK